MHDWLGIGLIALGLGLIMAGIVKRTNRIRTPLPAGAIRPEFAAMGEMVRPLILFAVGLVALKISLFYFLFKRQQVAYPIRLRWFDVHAGGLLRVFGGSDDAAIPCGRTDSDNRAGPQRSRVDLVNWPSGVQWEWAIGEFAVLGFLFWELYRLRRTQRQDRAKAQQAEQTPRLD